MRLEYSFERRLTKVLNMAQEMVAAIIKISPLKFSELNDHLPHLPWMIKKTPKKERKIPRVVRRVTSDCKNREDAMSTKIGEVAMIKAEFDAVVKLNPIDIKVRLKKMPKKARPTSQRKCLKESNQFFSILINKSTRIKAEMLVRTAAKFIGETSPKAILAKKKSEPQMTTAKSGQRSVFEKAFFSSKSTS